MPKIMQRPRRWRVCVSRQMHQPGPGHLCTTFISCLTRWCVTSRRWVRGKLAKICFKRVWPSTTEQQWARQSWTHKRSKPCISMTRHLLPSNGCWSWSGGHRIQAKLLCLWPWWGGISYCPRSPCPPSFLPTPTHCGMRSASIPGTRSRNSSSDWRPSGTSSSRSTMIVARTLRSTMLRSVAHSVIRARRLRSSWWHLLSITLKRSWSMRWVIKSSWSSRQVGCKGLWTSDWCQRWRLPVWISGCQT